jgi:transposase InsO family protein
MPFLKRRKVTKKEVARSLGIARSTLYYDSKLQKKDWDLKIKIEEVLHVHPAYGHKRLALALRINKKRIRRVMHVFGIKPYRRRPKKLYKKKDHGANGKTQWNPPKSPTQGSIGKSSNDRSPAAPTFVLFRRRLFQYQN